MAANQSRYHEIFLLRAFLDQTNNVHLTLFSSLVNFQDEFLQSFRINPEEVKFRQNITTNRIIFSERIALKTLSTKHMFVD